MTLLRTESNALILSSSWSPDGKRIAYCAFGAEDEDLLNKYPLGMHFPVYVMNADGSDRERLLDVPAEPYFQWSPDASRLVFSSGYEQPGQPRNQRSVGIYVFDVQTRRAVRLTALGQNSFPSWSPDGRRIVFSGEPDSQNSYIYAINPDGTNLQRLTTTGIAVVPVWSPRRELIAYVNAPRPLQVGVESGVFVMRPDGSRPRRIWTGVAQSGSWSPDGSHLLIASGLDSSPTTLVDMATGRGTELLPQGALDLTFAPDSRSILYKLSDAGPQGSWSIYKIGIQSRKVQKLTSSVSTFGVSPVLRALR